MEYANQKYEYDTKNIQYCDMSVDQWRNIQSDPSQYSQYWSTPQSFQPEVFSQNVEEKKLCMDKGWAIAFCIQFLITLCIFVWLLYAGKKDDSSVYKNDGTGNYYLAPTIDWGLLGKVLGFGFAVALILNILHGVYASYFPVIYIKFGFWCGFALSVVFGIVAIIQSSIIWVIFPIFSLFITICFYCAAKNYIKFSTVVFKQSMELIRRYPSVFILTFVDMLVDSLVSIIYSYMIFMVSELEYSGALYLWIVLSFLWTNITFGYVCYMANAGLAGSWYFLEGTQFFPQNPVWDSFKRATTTSFGSAAKAGFILAIIKFARWVVDQMQENNDNFLCCIILCMVQCILSCVERIFSWLNKYGLIYCSIFGVPYSEGCRRFQELSCKKFCDLIMRGSCISTAITYNMFIFIICSAVLGYIIGYACIDNDYLYAAYTCGIATIFAFIMFEILSEPLDVIPDAILVCFAENPERLKTTANELAQSIEELYHTSVSKLVRNS